MFFSQLRLIVFHLLPTLHSQLTSQRVLTLSQFTGSGCGLYIKENLALLACEINVEPTIVVKLISR